MTQKIAICALSDNLSGCVFATNACIDNRKKNMLNSNISSRCPHKANFGPLTAEICRRVWGTATNFNGFRVLASLLQRRRPPEANQTLHDVWPSPGLVRYVYTFGGSCPLTEFCPMQNSLYVQVGKESGCLCLDIVVLLYNADKAEPMPDLGILKLNSLIFYMLVS